MGERRKDPLIFFVDDDPAIVDATVMMLELADLNVTTAIDGREAIRMLESEIRPDMVITDFRLPGANGIELLQRARDVIGEHLPIVLMTGDTSSRAIEDAKLSNCVVLHKPVDTGQLIELIESLLNSVEPAA